MYLIEKTYLNIIKHDVVCFLKVIFVEQIVCLLTRKKGVDGDASTDLKKGPDVSGGSRTPDPRAGGGGVGQNFFMFFHISLLM